jgi:phosphoglycerate dehydrogenase-like enzyme/CMP-N-acetylneuraminic acid synthetase
MIGNKKVLVNILARSGSTSVKDKNIADLGGKPVLWYSVTEALKSKYADAICVSTDSPKYAKIAEEAGVKVPFLRAAKHSTKDSTAAAASSWTTLKYEKYSGETYDYIVDFMNSNPFKTVEDLDNCIEMLYQNKQSDTVVAVTRVWDGHPDRIKQIQNGELQDWPGTKEKLESLRQELTPEAYIRCGSVYAMKRHVLIEEGNRRGKVSIPYIMPDERVCNIDEPKDLLTARAMMNLRLKGDLLEEKFQYKVLAISKCDDLTSVKQTLSKLGDVDYKPDITQKELKSNVNNYDILFIPTHLKFDSSVWEDNSNIKVISTPSVGTDHIDIDFFTSKGVKVISLNKQYELTKTIYSPAEVAFSHLINLSRNIFNAVDDVKRDNWNPSFHMGNELYGKTVGIIGLGAVGTIMANYCKAFGMNIISYDPYKTILDKDIKQYHNLEDLLSISDVVSLHVNLTDETYHLLSKKELNHLKHNAILINTSRGEVIDHKSLLPIINSTNIKVGLDVLEGEIEKNQLYCDLIDISKNNNRVIITPHLGGSTIEARIKRSNFICKLLYKWCLNEN